MQLEAYFAFKIPFFKQEAENTEGQFDMRKYLSLGYLKDNVRTLKADQNILVECHWTKPVLGRVTNYCGGISCTL